MTKPGTITASDCINNQALVAYKAEEQNQLFKLIEKHVAKLFYSLGHDLEKNRIEILTELLIESRNYETPQTIISFLHKCAKGELGKFYGKPGIDQLQEKFASFLEQKIIPERERQRRAEAIGTPGRLSEETTIASEVNKIKQQRIIKAHGK